MAKIIIFNNDTDRMETYYRNEAEPMPYNTNSTLRVREFRGSSKSNILWTTKGGHGNQSQHYAGVAFDVGQTLTSSRRRTLWNSANNSGVWSYVEPISLTPTWVHFDKCNYQCYKHR